MDRKLTLKILEVLEKAYPYHVSTSELGEKLEAVKNKIKKEDIEPILFYLKESDKVKVTGEGLIREKLSGAENFIITIEGIDHLTELKLMESRDNESKRQDRVNTSIAFASVVIAMATFIELGLTLINMDYDKIYSSMGLIFGTGFLIALILALYLIGDLSFKARQLIKEDKVISKN